jgi:hypothetical protein
VTQPSAAQFDIYFFAVISAHIPSGVETII